MGWDIVVLSGAVYIIAYLTGYWRGRQDGRSKWYRVGLQVGKDSQKRIDIINSWSKDIYS